MSTEPALDPQEGRRLYGQDPATYDRGRPDYPPAVYDTLRTRCGLKAGARVLEVGPGTGLVTRTLIASGATVTAVEPNAAMASWLDAVTGGGLELIQAPFEEADLDAEAFDLAVAATSFHWIRPDSGAQKLHRALKRRGWVAIWWMLFGDPWAHDDFDRAVGDLLGHAPDPGYQPGGVPFQVDQAARRTDLESAGFVDVTAELITSNHDLSAAQLRDLYASTAIILRRPPDEQVQALDELEHIVIQRFGGSVKRTFTTALYTGHRR